jgi:hypothetical protein
MQFDRITSDTSQGAWTELAVEPCLVRWSIWRSDSLCNSIVERNQRMREQSQRGEAAIHGRGYHHTARRSRNPNIGISLQLSAFSYQPRQLIAHAAWRSTVAQAYKGSMNIVVPQLHTRE